MKINKWWEDLPEQLQIKEKEDKNIIFLNHKSKCPLCNFSLRNMSLHKVCDKCNTRFILVGKNKYKMITYNEIISYRNERRNNGR